MSVTLSRVTGYQPLSIAPKRIRARLSATIWRLLSVAERPAAYGAEISPLFVSEQGTECVVMTANHYNLLVGRLNDLETWLDEFVSEREAS